MPSIPPPLLHRLGQLSRTPAAFEFARAAKHPEKAQRKRLEAALRPNADTEFGRKHGFATIRTATEYAQRVPLMRPDDLQSWMARVVEGERNLLTAEDPVAYVTTTGSTGPAKYVPITPSYKAEFQKTVHVAVWHLYRRFPDAFRGRVLYAVGSRRVRTAPDGLDVGAMSGFNFTELPAMVRALYAWPYELFEVADLETRSFLALYLACLHPVTLIAGVFPAPIVYLLRELVPLAPELAEHLRRGTLPERLALTPEERAFFSKPLRPRPKVADRVARIEREPERAVALAMPRLRLTYCWTASTAGLFVPELKRLLGPEVAVRDAIYSACEGWCSIPMGEARPGGALAITSHYFEFLEVEAFDAGREEPLRWDQVEDGHRYYIVITHSGGLYRYLLGDIVEVCGFHERVPRIVFVRKAGAASDLVGEKLEETHVNAALEAVLDASGLRATWFSLVADPTGAKLGYDLFIEPARGVELPDDLGARVHDALCEAAAGYRNVRGSLRPVRLRRVPPGTYRAWRQQAVAAGAAESQLKTAHLLADPARLPEAIHEAAR